MKSIRGIRESPHYEKLKNSLERRVARNNAVTNGIITAVCLLLITIPAVMANDPAVYVLAFLPILMIMVPMVLFYVGRMVLIYQSIERYIFCEAVLDQPHGGFGRDCMYFTVTLRDRSGREFKADTNGIFYTRGIMNPLLEDCINKKALIAYNEETERVVVVKILER